MAQTFLKLDTGVTGTLPTSNYVQGGITMLDQWCCSDNQSISSGAERLITGYWSDWGSTDSGANIGSSMTQSSGIFTFPETGIYTIDFHFQFGAATGANDQAQIFFNVTTNNSSYTDALDPAGFFSDANDHYTATGHYAIDVTDTANVKFKFGAYSESVNTQINGSSQRFRSGFTVMKIGDT